MSSNNHCASKPLIAKPRLDIFAKPVPASASPVKNLFPKPIIEPNCQHQ